MGRKRVAPLCYLWATKRGKLKSWRGGWLIGGKTKETMSRRRGGGEKVKNFETKGEYISSGVLAARNQGRKEKFNPAKLKGVWGHGQKIGWGGGEKAIEDRECSLGREINCKWGKKRDSTAPAKKKKKRSGFRGGGGENHKRGGQKWSTGVGGLGHIRQVKGGPTRVQKTRVHRKPG